MVVDARAIIACVESRTKIREIQIQRDHGLEDAGCQSCTSVTANTKSHLLQLNVFFVKTIKETLFPHVTHKLLYTALYSFTAHFMRRHILIIWHNLLHFGIVSRFSVAISRCCGIAFFLNLLEFACAQRLPLFLQKSSKGPGVFEILAQPIRLAGNFRRVPYPTDEWLYIVRDVKPEPLNLVSAKRLRTLSQ